MENIKYFTSQVFKEEEKISEAEALARTWYVICHYSDNTPDFAEIIGHGKVNNVIYYNRKYPDETVLKQHISRYENCNFEVVLPLMEINGKYNRQIFLCNSIGEIQGINEEYLNPEGDLLKEVRMDSNRNLYGTIEYEYDESGTISIVRERNSDGKIISENEIED
ncbi:MAG: hypothetical protein QNJ32_24045 [Xenococcaceae cyanobacterium MO_167.B27]|nr:hypothetical protein [Xenococcaceae cyanobacterium MO_167.B27]